MGSVSSISPRRERGQKRLSVGAAVQLGPLVPTDRDRSASTRRVRVLSSSEEPRRRRGRLPRCARRSLVPTARGMGACRSGVPGVRDLAAAREPGADEESFPTEHPHEVLGGQRLRQAVVVINGIFCILQSPINSDVCFKYSVYNE